MNARKRGNALLLCIGLVLVLLVSSAFLIQEADHDCCGEDCPICRTIAMTGMLMRALFVIASAWLLFSVPAVLSARRASAGARSDTSDTPVSRKIRMND